MNRAIAIGLSIVLFSAAPALADAAPPTPSITLSGPEVEAVVKGMTQPNLFTKQPNGSLVPYIDPGVQAALQVIAGKLKAAEEAAKPAPAAQPPAPTSQ